MNSGNTIAPILIECPVCKNKMKNKTGIQAITIVCSHCFRIFNTRKNTNVGKVNKEMKSIIPLGSKGEFNHIPYEVVGYIQFRQYRTIYTWNEYVMFNVFHGYAFLSEYNGHWSFVKQTSDFSFENRAGFSIEEKTYRQYNEYKSSIAYAEGEFNWDILEAETKRVTEFLSPPNMLIREISPDSLIWYKAEHIEAKEVRESFNLKKNVLPSQKGIGPMSPPVMAQRLSTTSIITGIFILALFASQIILSVFAQDKEIFSSQYNLDSLNTIVTPSFKLQSNLTGKDNLEFKLLAAVDNSWFETAITLVNDETGEEFSFEQGVEYYHGYDDGYWSEGSTISTEILSQIPDGTYHMNITPYIDYVAFNRINKFTIEVKRGVTTWSNFLWLFFGVIVYPVTLYFRNENLEYQRWS